MLLRIITIVLGLCLWSTASAQGPELLIQQYNKYPYDLEFYRKWNFDLFVQSHISNTTNRVTKGRIQLDGGANVYYQFTKTIGLSSGIHFSRTGYRYDFTGDQSIDRIRFLRFPLLLNVYPVKRVRISLGGSYNWKLNATGQPPPATERIAYGEKTFVNSLGIMVSAHYRIWKKFSLGIDYRFQKHSANPLQRETQNFNGMGLSVYYTLLNPSQRKK